MAEDEQESIAVRMAVLLREIDDAELDCPEGVDRFTWSADLLDEMARAVEAIARIVSVHAATDVDALLNRSAELSREITHQRNLLMRYGRGARPDTEGRSARNSAGRTSTEPTPRAGRTGSTAQRLMQQEWADRHGGAGRR